jgi:hypothetical protein
MLVIRRGFRRMRKEKDKSEQRMTKGKDNNNR